MSTFLHTSRHSALTNQDNVISVKGAVGYPAALWEWPSPADKELQVSSPESPWIKKSRKQKLQSVFEENKWVQET